MSGWGTCPSDRQLLLTEQLFVHSHEMKHCRSSNQELCSEGHGGPVCWAPWSMTYGMHWTGSHPGSILEAGLGVIRAHVYLPLHLGPGEGHGRSGSSVPAVDHAERAGVEWFKSSIEKWGVANSAACECGEPEQNLNLNRLLTTSSEHDCMTPSWTSECDTWEKRGEMMLNGAYIFYFCGVLQCKLYCTWSQEQYIKTRVKRGWKRD